MDVDVEPVVAKTEQLSINKTASKAYPTVYVFHRSNLQKYLSMSLFHAPCGSHFGLFAFYSPVMHLPCQHPSIAVRFSPVFYARRHPDGKKISSS
jgi:hypothetical protein